MSKVTAAKIVTSVPADQDTNTVYVSGTSAIPFQFVSAVLAGGYTNVYLRRTTGTLGTVAPSATQDCAVVTTGTAGSIIQLTTSATSVLNWSVRVRPTTAGSTTGQTFTSGTGGGRAVAKTAAKKK
jgi:hypothetical protein